MNKKEMDPLDVVLSYIFKVSEEGRNIAKQWIKTACMDVKTAKREYKYKNFSISAGHLQQAVEKATKALGYYTGSINVEEEDKVKKEIGHFSYKVYTVFQINEFYDKIVYNLKSWLPNLERELSSFAHGHKMLGRVFKNRIEKSNEYIQELSEFVKKIDNEEFRKKLCSDKSELLELSKNRDEMLEASLYLDKRNKWINAALEGIQKPPVLNRKVRRGLSILFSKRFNVKIPKQCQKKSWVVLGTCSAMSKLLPLSLLTCWHHEAGYPENAPKYTEQSPYVKMIPRLLDMTLSAINDLNLAVNSLDVVTKA
jgi:HEPN domain-containing protein